MTGAERIRKFPKTGWRNLLARHLAALPKLPAPTEFIGYQTQTALQSAFRRRMVRVLGRAIGGEKQACGGSRSALRL